MGSFSLVIEYLTGYAVATDPSSRERPEWPPHPARIFMAMAAAHFETDGDAQQKRAERDALEWLSTLGPPDIVVPPSTARDVLAVYVPVNDQHGGLALAKRSRQPRTFPRVYVGAEPVRFTWHLDPEAFPKHMTALETVCRQVTRVGHSSSLVWVRMERGPTHLTPTFVPDDRGLDHRLRRVSAGVVTRLEKSFNRDAIDQFAQLEREIELSKGATKKNLKAELASRFPNGRPVSQRPVISLHQGYRATAPPLNSVYPSVFDPHFIVLRADDDAKQTFGLESTLRLVDALRKLIMSSSGIQPVPEWVSGHEANGERLQSRPHIAMIPLAFVGRQHADGHLLGLGIIVPRDVPPVNRGRVLSPLLFDLESGAPRSLKLLLGDLGTWELEREAAASSRMTLQTRTYTHSSRSWASVTPIVLDRMPKSDRVKEPLAWREEVATSIAASCEKVGLPAPESVRVEKTPFFIGSLRAMPGQGGFPQFRKGTFQLHAQIEFSSEVSGPVLLGAGRFRGYGLLRPWKEDAR